MWRTDCVGHPQVQCGVVFGTWMLASHAFRPRTSVRSRNAAVDSAFVCPSYRGRVAFDHGVLYIVAFFAFAALSQRRFHSLSAHLAMHVVDLHLCWWPPILCCLCVALPARRRFSACCCSSSRVSCSFSLARRRRARIHMHCNTTIHSKFARTACPVPCHGYAGEVVKASSSSCTCAP